MNKKKTASPPLVSGSSLLVIFAILCLTTFALLSLSTVQAHLRQMDHLNQAVLDYYAADCQAEETLARLRGGETPEGVASYGDDLNNAHYTVPVSDSQALAVEAALQGPDAYEVVRWQLVSTGEWTPDDSLTVWDGQVPAGSEN